MEDFLSDDDDKLPPAARWHHRVLGIMVIVVLAAFVAGMARIAYAALEWIFS